MDLFASSVNEHEGQLARICHAMRFTSNQHQSAFETDSARFLLQLSQLKVICSCKQTVLGDVFDVVKFFCPKLENFHRPDRYVYRHLH
jgi:hypothetical protein